MKDNQIQRSQIPTVLVNNSFRPEPHILNVKENHFHVSFHHFFIMSFIIFKIINHSTSMLLHYLLYRADFK